MICCLPGGVSAATFVKQGPFVLGHPGGHTYVVVSVADSAPGILVVHLNQPINVLAFDVARLPREGAQTLFLAFNKSKNRFEALQTAAQRYTVRGSVSFSLGNPASGFTRVSIDQTSTPYVTVVADQKQDSAILAFAGLEQIANKGNDLVPILEASRLLSEELQKVFTPFELGTDKKLHLNGEVFAGTSVGIQPEPDNPCLRAGASVVHGNQLAQFLESTAADGTRPGQMEFSSFLFLSSTSKYSAVLELASGEFGAVVPVKEIDPKTKGRICTFSPVKVE